MLKNPLISVGKVRDAHGLKGELFCVLFAHDPSWIDRAKSLILEHRKKNEDGKLVPVQLEFPIRRSKIHKKGLIIRVDGIDDRTQAEAFRGAMVLVPENIFITEPGERIFLRELLGFQLVQDVNIEGEITGFSSNNVQDLLVVETPRGKFEIPLVEDFIQQIDFKKKQIKMELPKGLLGEEA